MFHFLHAIARYSGELNLSEAEYKAGRVLADLFFLTGEIQRYMEKRAREFGVSYGQYILLCVLRHQPDRQSSPSVLADALKVSRAAVSSMIEALEKAGFILRRLDERDRRGMVISLTDAGDRKVEEMTPQFLSLMTRFVSEFEESDVDDLLQSLAKLKKGFDKGEGN
ncbi:MarR family winged helix-turn-helix transcriptional regulator [Paenibacillus sp. M1]|uniref:MarR family winged helix-turn-helix transcriptional regulator n=1 Tax=Paenibacillus haidiansis TaxID=1574488 RepID=A0ABU7VTU4_9BACL